MRGNVVRGSGFRGLLNYVFSKGDRCELVGGNMSGHSHAELSREFGVARRLRPDVERPVWHLSLSLQAGETRTPEEWDAIVRAMLIEIGIDPDRHQYAIVRHRDTDHEHVHIVLSRIRLDGKLWHGAKDAEAVQKATPVIERRFGLQQFVADPRVDPEPPIRMSRGERQLWKQRGLRPPKIEIAEAIDRSMRECDGTLVGFCDALRHSGILVRPFAKEGRLAGISFSMTATWRGGSEAIAVAGRTLGKSYSAGAISRRLDERRAELGFPIWPTEPRRPARVHPGVASDTTAVEDDTLSGIGPCVQGHKRRLLAAHYKVVLSVEIEPLLWWVRPNSPFGPLIVALRTGHHILDHGDLLTLRGGPAPGAAAAMMMMAQAKGWATVRPKGSDQFKALIWLEAQRRGLEVEGYDPPDAVRRTWEMEKEQCAAATGDALTGAPVPSRAPTDSAPRSNESWSARFKRASPARRTAVSNEVPGGGASRLDRPAKPPTRPAGTEADIQDDAPHSEPMP